MYDPVSSPVPPSRRALRHCEEMIQRYSRQVAVPGPALPHASHSNVGKAVEDCMRAIIGLLLNLTHDNGERLTHTPTQLNVTPVCPLSGVCVPVPMQVCVREVSRSIF